MKRGKSTVVQLRVPVTLHRGIAARATDERRTWTQMAVILLEDALIAQSGLPLPQLTRGGASRPAAPHNTTKGLR